LPVIFLTAFSDLTMPRVNGRQTQAALYKLSHGIPANLSNSYDKSQDMAGEHPELPDAFLGKPNRLKGFRESIGQVLLKNNMLSIILGHTELAIGNLDPAHPIIPDLEEIHGAATRSADLTRQLLAFARKQSINPKILDLNETVEGMLKMLRRLIGEEIALTWQPGMNLWQVLVDPSQIDQILANLCINARDAVSGVGQVTIKTEIGPTVAGRVRRVDVQVGDRVRAGQLLGGNGSGGL
jgi:hypothetical protein